MSIPDVQFNSYLMRWKQVLAYHRFIVEVRTFPLKNGGVRRKADALGYDMNGQILHPQAFPATFVRFITDNFLGVKQDGNMTTYQLDFGMLIPTFLRYCTAEERKAKISNLLQ